MHKPLIHKPLTKKRPLIAYIIDRGDREENERLFTHLYRQRHSIEQSFGFALQWENLQDGKGFRILWSPAAHPSKGAAESPGGELNLADWATRLYTAVQSHLPQG